mgnify:CR=1 FL=1
MPTPNLPQGFDPLDPDICVRGLPVGELAELRRAAPVWWCEQRIGKGGFNDGGYWVVTKLKDVKEVSRRNDIYSSWENTAIPQFPDDMAREDIDLQRFVMLNMDGEHHDRLRRIISRGFTPRAINRLRDELDHRAQNIAKAAAAQGGGDFVEQVACELPLQAIADLLGVPQDDREKLFRWSNEMTGNDDSEFDVDPKQSSMEVLAYAMQMAEVKAKEPGEDIVTALINADIDGEKLSDDEFGFFVMMLAVAGNETTRNSITHGMIAFANNPEQWELYKKERPETAADEIVRWATPVTAFQRTALVDTELGGANIPGSFGITNFGLSTFDDTDGDGIPDVRTPNVSQGVTAGILSGDNFNLPILISALAGRRDSNVLNIPSVLVNNNGSAKVVSKDEQPTTQVTATGVNGGTQENFRDYVSAGITMQISPTISASRYLRLKVSLEVSVFQGAVNGAIPPPKVTRTIDTTVNVPDGDTMVIGGIVTDNKTRDESKVPILGDIPILGHLFGKNADTSTRTTLYFFVTPHILRDKDFADLAEVSYQKKLDAADTIGVDRIRVIDPKFGQSKEEMDLRGFEVPLYKSPARGEVDSNAVGMDPARARELIREARAKEEAAKKQTEPAGGGN